MNSFSGNIYYQKAKKLRYQKYLFVFVLFVVLYISQLIFVYVVFIPRALEHYDKFPEMQELIRPILGLLDNFSFFWPIMFFCVLGTMIFYTWNIQKMIASIDSYQKQNKMSAMDSIKDNTYYQRAKKVGHRFYIFLFFVLLILYIFVFTFAYVSIIPKALNIYESSQTLNEHIKITLKMKANLSIFWAIMLLFIIGIMIRYVKNTQNLVNSINKYQRIESV